MLKDLYWNCTREATLASLSRTLSQGLQGVSLYPTESDVWHDSPDDRLHD
jgi:hypothetical protein